MTAAPSPNASPRRNAGKHSAEVARFLDGLRSDFPELRCTEAGGDRDWSLLVRTPLASPDLPLRGDLILDMPCTDETSDLLDDALSGDAQALDAIPEALAGDRAEVVEFAAHHLPRLNQMAERDFREEPNRDRVVYIATLERHLSGRCIRLYPEPVRAVEDRYNAGHHIKDILKDARHSARKASHARKRPA